MLVAPRVVTALKDMERVALFIDRTDSEEERANHALFYGDPRFKAAGSIPAYYVVVPEPKK